MAAQLRSSRSNRRIMQEIAELEADPPADFSAAPLENSLFEWHFTLAGVPNEFAGGMYHGRLLLPPEYPLRPPEIYLLTPNGRFELNKRICLSITGFHEDSWQPAWGIRTALLSLSAFFSTEAKGAIAGLDTPAPERRRLAELSPLWTCPICMRKNRDLIPEHHAPAASVAVAAIATATPGAASDAASDGSTFAQPTAPRAEASSTSSSVPLPQPQPESRLLPGSQDTIAATRVAGPMTRAPPSMLDRVVALLLIAAVGFVARSL